MQQSVILACFTIVFKTQSQRSFSSYFDCDYWGWVVEFSQVVGVGLRDLAYFLHKLLWPHALVFGSFALALLVVARLFAERRTPSNTLAWSLVILTAPYIGVPLYFMFGGRKSRRLVAHKKDIRALAENLRPSHGGSQTPPIWKHCEYPQGGNSFQLLEDGQKSLECLLAEIDQATTSIHIATYILDKDVVGKLVIEHLARRVLAGVQVRLLLDALGSFHVSKSFLRPLLKAGGQVARFMPVLPLYTKMSSNLRNHRKMAIFDSQKALVGGQNLSQRFMGTIEAPALFEDFGALISGPAVSMLSSIFVSDWCFASGEAPEQLRSFLAHQPAAVGTESVQIISSGPDVEADPLWESLITLIQDCQTSLTIVTPYFVPDEVLFRSLIVKARTGRQVRLILPKKSNHPLVDVARLHFLRPLKEAGAQIELYDAKMLHAKAFIVDNAIGMIGSANFDLRSLFVNFEVGVFIKSPASLDQLQAWIHTLSPHLQPFDGGPIPTPSRRWLEDIAHILAPLL